MTNAGILGMQNPSTGHNRALFLGGLDVLAQPGSMDGSGYGVPLSSIRVVERGAGGVSSMSFDISDPSHVVRVVDGQVVQYQDLVNDSPTFLGFVDDFTAEVDFGNQGRTWHLSCTGAEALLDWALIPTDMTFPAATLLQTVIQSLAANAAGRGPLRSFSSTTLISRKELPTYTSDEELAYAITITAGTSLREAIRQTIAANGGTAGLGSPTAWRCTVDFLFGLRVYGPTGPADSVFVFIDDDTSGTWKMKNLSYRTEAATVRGVFVKGANAAGTGLVSDGSGKIGPIASLSDSTVDTAAKLAATGAAYLAARATPVRGSLELEALDPSTMGAAGNWMSPAGNLTLVATVVGINTLQFQVYEIAKTFNGDRSEDWRFSFGGLAPSLTGELRRLTRDTRA